MKTALLSLACLSLAAQAPVDPKDQKPLLLGPTTREAILGHRAVFQENLGRVHLSPALAAQWKAVRRPLTLVAVFGSWCSDSQEQLPGLLALEPLNNPFIEVHYVGVARDKAVPPTAWPVGCAPQAVQKVPTFYLFASQPGGGQTLVGTVVETPPRVGQSMAEALVELAESAVR
jgi:hypothetical protein